jgi:hypothetical protein
MDQMVPTPVEYEIRNYSDRLRIFNRLYNILNHLVKLGVGVTLSQIPMTRALSYYPYSSLQKVSHYQTYRKYYFDLLQKNDVESRAS